jgi:hypothetical protein
MDHRCEAHEATEQQSILDAECAPHTRLEPRARLLHWNGRDLPPELRELPAGDYVVESVDLAAPLLSQEEEDEITVALESYDRRGGIELTRVRQLLDTILER